MAQVPAGDVKYFFPLMFLDIFSNLCQVFIIFSARNLSSRFIVVPFGYFCMLGTTAFIVMKLI